MKNKNKKLMIVVACLLVVIGVSFAYFVASDFIGGSGSSADFTTATIQGSELRVDGNLTFNDLDIYPGHQNVSSIKVTATGDNELIPYNVIWEGTNTLNTSLNYTIYKTSSEVDVSASCEQQRGVIDGAMMYYEECSISNIADLGSSVSTGTINSNDTKVTLISDEFITSTTSGTEIYYYVILEYPNLEENQNSDIGGSFTGKVTLELNDAEPDVTIIGVYIENSSGTYEEVEEAPKNGYELNTEKSVCTNNAEVGWDVKSKEVYIRNFDKSGTDCTLYFDEKIYAKDYILSYYDTVLTRDNFSTTITSTTTGTIYKSLDESQYDNDGEVYYFAGNPTDNWLQFGGYYWRIIRINGNGSIRVIYSGNDPLTIGSNDYIQTNIFNSYTYGDNMYVGYMYKNGEVHGLENFSSIKSVVDNWYNANLSNYTSYLDEEVGFCGDRTPSTNSSSSNGQGGTNSTATYYGANIRFTNSGYDPIYYCADDQDLYTLRNSSKGNQALDYPVGLITVDEVAYAGGVWGASNDSYYLNIGEDYWTISPSHFILFYANVYYVSSTGSFTYAQADTSSGVRPVINLKADVQLTGSGTPSDPYRLA